MPLEAIRSLEDRFEISNLHHRTTCIRSTGKKESDISSNQLSHGDELIHITN